MKSAFSKLFLIIKHTGLKAYSFWLQMVVGLPVLCGCTNFMLHPDKIDHAPGFSKAHIVEEGFLRTETGGRLRFWRIPAQSLSRRFLEPARGLIVLCPGNGSNLTDHVQNSVWLAEQGFDLLIFDYRGHGHSTGRPSIAGSYADVETILDFASVTAKKKSQQLYFYGQSLGGTLLLKAISRNPTRWRPEAVIAEDPFYSFKEIAMERVNAAGAPFPVGWYTYLMFSDHYSLREDELARISPIPVLLFCSSSDPVVSEHHCQSIDRALAEPKLLTRYAEPGHLQAMVSAQARSRTILMQTLLTKQKALVLSLRR